MTQLKITSGHGMQNASVIVNGKEISQEILGAHIEMGYGEFNQVALILKPHVELELESEITMVQQGIGPEFLSDLDTSRLHDAAVNMEWENTNDLVANVISLLKEVLDDQS